MTSPVITQLSNGLRVVTDRIDHVETASVGMWVGAGTRREEPQVNGVAHMLEHMAFKGTKRRNAREIAEEIENVGGQLNAHTAREQTAYYAKVLKNDAGLAIDVLSDIVQHSLVDDVELGRERSVVLQEIGQAHDTPDDVVFDHFQSTAFPDQPLGRPVLGKSEIVAAMSRDAIVGFHDEHYRTSRMVVATLRGEVPDSQRPLSEPVGSEAEREIALVLEHVWFASLLGWASGLHSEAEVNERMATTARLLLDPA